MGTSIENLILDNLPRLKELQDTIDYQFNDTSLLQQALIHSSYSFEQLGGEKHNETLEFLGDAVLDLTVGYILFMRYPKMREGKLTRMRSSLVSEPGLAAMALKVDLGRYLLLGKGEDASCGRKKSSILSCAYEALIGALFIDGGYDAALAYVKRSFEPMLDEGREMLMITDAKSGLQEYLQEHFNEGPGYVLDNEEGPAHARIFYSSVVFQGEVLGSGKASNKKEAEQQAAREALEKLVAKEDS